MICCFPEELSMTRKGTMLSMTRKGTSLGEAVMFHRPSLVWCMEKVRKGGKDNVNGVECLR